MIVRKTAKEIIAESFRELAAIKPVDKITIQEIVENCGYSTATFYRNFHDKYDLIAWDYVYHTGKIMDRVGVDNYQWKNTLTDGVNFFQKNKEYILNLIQHTNGHDAFVRHMTEANIKLFSKCILQSAGMKELDPDTGVYVRLYCYGTVQVMCEWIMGKMECDGPHLAALFEGALPEPLRRFLYKE